ncbi:MAG TPA: TIGR03790 family protein [Nitrospiraceae bacterium]|nr:TIGR03790 family protein [Nitrospiraceae bacterium]
MTRSVHVSLYLLVCVWVSTAVSSAFGELTADHVAILANRNSSDSLAVARYYATRRGIPLERIVQLDLPARETMTRQEYEERLVRPVRVMLEANGLTRTTRVLVTTYGMPLRVDAPQPNESERRWVQEATERQRFARAYLAQIPEWAGHVAPSRPSEDSSSTPSTPKTIEGDRVLLEQVNRAISEAAERLKRAELHEARGTIEQWNQQLARIMVQAGGTAALVRNIQSADYQTQANVLKLREQVLSAQTAIRVLTDVPSDTNRKQVYQLTERMFGLKGILSLATAEIETYSYKDGDASLDSELALLWWDRDQYPVAGRFQNPLFHGSGLLGNPTPSQLPIIIVSRLDAPTSQLAMHLVDQAMETEQQGLTGKAYIDSRGIQADGTVGYGYYDQGLRDLADLLRTHSTYPVMLEDTERRFSQRGEAPDVAIYAGWYKLRSYEDAFTFNPGAIGYHIASGEAVSIHDPNEAGWCKNALERGIAVTLGPTGEPYVDAFPLPNEFFALLLTGRYSLAESYALTTRYVSWRMVLFGDPLYNPWRGRGMVEEKETVLQRWRGATGTMPIAPFALPFSDPLKTRKELTHQRETALHQAQLFLDKLTRPTKKQTR